MRCLIVFLGLAILLPVCSAASDVVVPVDPPAHRTIEYREVWRTDPYSEDYLMGNVRRVIRDAAGDYYLLDVQLQEVFKFDAAGKYLKTVVRKGEGPGEIDQTWNLEFWPPNQIVLPRSFPPQIVRVDPEGNPLEELRVYRKEGDDAPASVFDIDPVGDVALVHGNAFMFDEGGSRAEAWIGVINRDGTVLRELGSRSTKLATDPRKQVLDEKAEYWEWERYVLHPDGLIFRAPDREAWVVERFDLEGNLTGRFTRDIGARPRVKKEYDDIHGSRSFVFNGQKAEIDYQLLDTEPPISGLRCVGDALWVVDNPAPGSLPDNIWITAAVLSVDGEFLESVELGIDHDPELDIVQMLGDGTVIVFENGVAANQAALASFGVESDDEELADAEPAVIVVYEPVR